MIQVCLEERERLQGVKKKRWRSGSERRMFLCDGVITWKLVPGRRGGQSVIGFISRSCVKALTNGLHGKEAD